MTLQRKNVLVVEDSSSMRAYISAALAEFMDADIVEAENGFHALKLLPTKNYDLILTDINMPDINGLELIRYIRDNENYSTIPVIIISTENTEEDRKRGLALGADKYLDKPFEPAELQELVNDLLNTDEG